MSVKLSAFCGAAGHVTSVRTPAVNLYKFTTSLCLALTGLLNMSMAQVSGPAKEITSLGIPGRFFLVQLNYSWGKARLYCKTTYQDLAEIPPKVLNPQMKSTKAWIGMSRSMESLDWLWVSGQTANITQAGLAKDTDYYPDCMALTSLGKWEKTTCEQQNNFICIDNAPSSTKAPNPTKETTTPAVSSRLSFVELNYTWGRARQHCKSNNLDLAELPPAVTDPKMKWMKAWIGLSRPMESLDWLWVSGQSANITQAGLSKDTEYYPDCMVLTSLGKWEKTKDCAQQNYFICMDNAKPTSKSTVGPFLGPSTLTGQNYNGNNRSSLSVGGVTADPKAVTSQTKQGNWNTTRNGNAGGKTVAPSQNMNANITVLNLLSKATCVVSPVTGLLTVAVVFASSVVKFS